MRGPDAASRGGTGGEYPAGPQPPTRRLRALQQVDDSEARQDAHDGGDDQQPPVMLGGEAVENSEHPCLCVSLRSRWYQFIRQSRGEAAPMKISLLNLAIARQRVA